MPMAMPYHPIDMRLHPLSGIYRRFFAAKLRLPLSCPLQYPKGGNKE